MEKVPVLDFRRAESDRSAFVQELGRSLEHFGFVCLTHHGIENARFEQGYELALELFGLPTDVKRGYEHPEEGRKRGYTGMGVERAKDHPVPDIKEFWHVGRELSADHPSAASGETPRNYWPTEVPAFRAHFEPLFLDLDAVGVRILECVGEFLGRPAGFFEDCVRDGTTVLRIINYPEMDEPPVPGAVRAAAHEDINLMTLLPASTRPGLQLLTREGQWLAVDAPAGALICDTGDMMQLLTHKRLPATTHRVVNPEQNDGGRLSMPFFVHPRNDFVLEVVDGEAITAGAFLDERLRENGVL